MTKFQTLNEAIAALGEKKCLQYINRMYLNTLANQEKLKALKEEGSGAKLRSYIGKRAAKLADPDDRAEVESLLGIPISDME